MTTFKLTLELANNSRVIAGLSKCEHLFTSYWGFAELPDGLIKVTLEDLDFGRYDSEGDDYIYELVGIVAADLINSYIEEAA